MLEGITQSKLTANKLLFQGTNNETHKVNQGSSDLERTPEKDTLNKNDNLKKEYKILKKSFIAWLVGSGVAIIGSAIFYFSRKKAGKVVEGAVEKAEKGLKKLIEEAAETVKEKVSSKVKKNEPESIVKSSIDKPLKEPLKPEPENVPKPDAPKSDAPRSIPSEKTEKNEISQNPIKEDLIVKQENIAQKVSNAMDTENKSTSDLAQQSIEKAKKEQEKVQKELDDAVIAATILSEDAARFKPHASDMLQEVAESIEKSADNIYNTGVKTAEDVLTDNVENIHLKNNINQDNINSLHSEPYNSVDDFFNSPEANLDEILDINKTSYIDDYADNLQPRIDDMQDYVRDIESHYDNDINDLF